MKFFQDCKTVEEIKARYRTLARQHHPDLGGDEETMKQVNSEYHEALKSVNGQESAGGDGKTHRYSYNEETEQKIIDFIQQILAIGMENVDVVLIGLWVWVMGETKPHKDSLKAAGCRWHSSRGCWYWKPYEGHTRSSSASLGDLARKYGYEKFDKDQKPAKKKRAIAS